MEIKNTILWKAFEEKASIKHQTIVSDLLQKAAERLILVRDTFPTYTLHNELHSINIVNLIGDLLGNAVDDVSDLELAILLLSAYYHDIGMVFSPEERDTLQNEIYFNDFIETYPTAQLKIKELEAKNGKNNIPEDIAEWYCRWIHPDRSNDYIKKMPDISWNGFPINDAVALVCKSHGYAIKVVIKWESLQTDFLGEADLLFCSILLRLADILDFDNSRSPEEVYKYLGLSEKRNKRENLSDIEWRKHLNSAGFTFPKIKDRDNERYPLRFIAAPDEPAVEYDIRQFLNIIEQEIEKSNSVLKSCSTRWYEFKLPFTINKTNIKSKGYSYGDYRFTLEQNQIMDLLMGENLYSDNYAFIRELVQNAIDTTKHRIEYEKSLGNNNFEPKPIELSYWTDSDGYSWFRIDDYGMGMDENIIKNYFLKVGNSYYKSEEFKIELLNYNTDFMPISRFGIGILSCFIIGDKIELNTRKVISKLKHNALRMSLRGINGFYTLKKEYERHHELSMPNEFNKNEGYRKSQEFGTSIAIRFNPKKESVNFNIRETLEEYVLCSPILLKFNGEHIGGNYKEIIENTWLKSSYKISIDKKLQQEIEHTLKLTFSKKIHLIIEPINLTKFSPSTNLKGQGVNIRIEIPEEEKYLFNNNNNSNEKRILQLNYNRLYKTNSLELTATYRDESKISNLHLLYRSTEIDAYIDDARSLIWNKINFLELDFNTKNNLTGFLDEKITFINFKDIIDIQFINDKVLKTKIRTLYDEISSFLKTKSDIYNSFRKFSKSLPDYLEKIKTIIPQISYHWISHNGIKIPLQIHDELKIKYNTNNGILFYNLSLQNNLRPNFTLSRDSVKSIPWQIYSDVYLMFTKALEINNILMQESMPHPTQEELSRDNNIILENGWTERLFIKTKEGRFSINKIKRETSLGKEYSVNDILYTRIYGYYSFINICIMAVIQKHLTLKYNIDKNHYLITKKDDFDFKNQEKLYPPLFFIEFNTNKLLCNKFINHYNKKHKFSIWLIENTESLIEKYYSIYDDIKSNLQLYLHHNRIDGYHKKDIKEYISNINNRLQKLRDLNYENKPDKSLFLTENDFVD